MTGDGGEGGIKDSLIPDAPAVLPGVPVGEEPAEHLTAAQFGDVDLWCAFRPVNDRGNAARLVARFGERLRYLPEHGWVGWDGCRWSRQAGEAFARKAAHQTIEAMRGEAAAVAKARPEMRGRPAKLLEWATASGGSGHISGMLKEASAYLQSSVAAFDRQPDVLTVPNGTLTLGREVRFSRRHRPELLITRCTAVAYDPVSPPCPRWLEFLAEVLPDPSVREFVQRWWGYCLTGHTSEQILVLHYGTGANGKSTALDIISAVIGDYASILPFEALLEDKFKRGGEATPDLARLPGTRFVVSTEPDPGRSLAESQIKRLTGETTLLARALRMEFFEFTPQFKLNLAANKKPRVRGQDHGTWRRLRLVPWLVRVDKPVKDLARQIVAEEGPGVLAWLVEAARLWYQDGLKVPPAVEAMTELYRGENDPVGRFVAGCVRRSAGAGELTAKALYDAYEAWAKACGEEPVSRRAFGVALTDLGFVRGKNSVVTYLGVQLADADAGMAV
jgi:putative DNA primase/helicase